MTSVTEIIDEISTTCGKCEKEIKIVSMIVSIKFICNCGESWLEYNKGSSNATSTNIIIN